MTNYMYKRNRTKNDISKEALEDSAFQEYYNVVGNDYYLGKVYTYIEYQEDYDITDEDIIKVLSNYKNFGKDLLLIANLKLQNLLSGKKYFNLKENDVSIVTDAIVGDIIWEKMKSF